MASFRDTPAYQRMIARMGRIRPEQRAILNTLSIDEEFADEETRRKLQALSHQQNVDYRGKTLDLRTRANLSYMESRNKELDLRSKARMEDLGLRRQTLDFRSGAIAESQALRESTSQDTQRRERTAGAVGLGNVIASYDYGRKRDEIDLETYRKLRSFMKKYEV